MRCWGTLGLTWVVTTACGRFGFDPIAGDGAPSDSVTIDASPFGPPVPLTTFNSGFVDVDPSMTADGLQLFFCTNRAGTFDVYASVRAATTDPWPAPTRVDPGVISTISLEQDAVISADGLTLYFTRSGAIYQAIRSTPTGAFEEPTLVPGVNRAGAQDTMSSITPDQLALTLSSTRSGGQGAADIYLATRPAIGMPWTVEPMPGAINGDRTDSDSFLSADRLTLYFDSNRPDGGSDFNIYIARRASASAPFDPPVPVDELNSSEAEGDAWLSADGSSILFIRGPLLGDLDIYEARR